MELFIVPILVRMILFLLNSYSSYLNLNNPALQAKEPIQQTVEALVVQMQLSGTISPTEITQDTPEIIISNRVTQGTIQTTVPAPVMTLPTPTLTFKESFGVPKVSETFVKGSNGFGLRAGENEDISGRLTCSSDGLLMEPTQSKGWKSWRLRPPVLTSAIAEMDFNFLSCGLSDQVGIVMHAPSYDEGKGYYFAIDCNGIMTLYRDNDALAAADASAILRKDPAQLNRLSAQINGTHLEFWLNEVKAIEAEDNTYTQGYNGIFSAPAYANTLKVLVKGFYLYY